MVGSESSNFNNIIQEIIKKSSFTERQLRIILDRRGVLETQFDVSKGAYYRQLGQTRDKLVRFCYALVMFRSLGVLAPDDMDTIVKVAERVSVISGDDMSFNNERDVINVIDTLIRQACKL